MSGGAFDYSQHYIREIADSIEECIDNNDSEELDEWEYPMGAHYNDAVIARLKEAVRVLRRATIMAQRADWLFSDDDGEDSFLSRWDEDLKELEEEEK